MEEIWKTIEDNPNYEVSNLGRVRSIDKYVKTSGNSLAFRKGRILKPSPNQYGYIVVQLWDKQKCVQRAVHRCMAEAFLPIPKELVKYKGTYYLQVNHKDENKQNNIIWVNEDGSIDYDKSNLEWCSAKYNTNYGTAIKRRSEKQKNVPRPCQYKKILIFKNGEIIKTCDGAASASEFLGCKIATIYNHISNPKRHKTVKGFVLKYAS